MIKNKNTAFEIFRAMAVTMVLVGHFAALSKDLPLIAKNILYSFNSYGLAIFFVISGFFVVCFLYIASEQTRSNFFRRKIFFHQTHIQNLSSIYNLPDGFFGDINQFF